MNCKERCKSPGECKCWIIIPDCVEPGIHHFKCLTNDELKSVNVSNDSYENF